MANLLLVLVLPLLPLPLPPAPVASPIPVMVPNRVPWARRPARRVGCSQIPAGLHFSAPSARFSVSTNVETQEPIYFDPQERERQKQASREADELALAKGVSAAEIESKNAFLTPDCVVIHWDPNREF